MPYAMKLASIPAGLNPYSRERERRANGSVEHFKNFVFHFFRFSALITTPKVSSSSATTMVRPAAKQQRLQQQQQLDEDVLIPLLVRRSYHLPGNNWYEDWIQWFRNNHILLGICLHHPVHPLETWERYLLLLSSISFGLVATSFVYQLYDRYPGVMALPLLAATDALGMWTDLFQTRITVGTIALWTVGGLFHSLYDMLIWHVMACACCHPGGTYYRPDRPAVYKNLGSMALVPVILALLGTATYLILLRASTEGATNDNGEEEYYDGDFANNGGDNNGDDQQQAQEELENIHWDDLQGIQSFSFLFKSSTELLLAWFVYFPIIGSVLFSGILGCNGRLPILGGRPRDIRIVQQEQLEHNNHTSPSSSKYQRSW
jgi:hypothetical protein